MRRRTGSGSCSRCSSTSPASRAPSWCPSRRRTSCSTTESGSPGYAVGAIGQQPCDPDLIAIPDVDSYTPLPWVRAGPGPRALRPARGGRAWPFAPRVILKAMIAERGAAGPRAVRRRRGRVLPGRARRGRQARARRHEGRRSPALLRRPRSDPHVRPPDRRLRGDERPRLGQLRQRPRGRQRPVRAELRLRRRADHGRPGDHRAVPDLGARRAARHDRHVHAQAVRRPHRQPACTCTCRCGATGRPASPQTAPRPTGAASGSRRWPTAFLGGHPRPRAGPAGGARPDRQLLQADRGDVDAVRRDLVAPPGELRRQRPHPLRADPGRPPHRAARRGRLGQPLPRARRDPGRRPRRHRARGRPGRPRHRPGRDRPPRPAAHAAARGRRADRRPGRRRRAWTPPARESPRTSRTSSARSSSTGTAPSAPGSIDRYLTAF